MYRELILHPILKLTGKRYHEVQVIFLTMMILIHVLFPLLSFKVDGMFAVEVKIAGKEEFITLTGKTIDEYRRALASRLNICEKRVRFEAAGKGCIILVFHIPDEVKDDLRKAAKNKAQWMTELNITGLHIRGEGFISLTAVSAGEWTLKPYCTFLNTLLSLLHMNLIIFLAKCSSR